jgi:hypothetical protein
MRKSFCLVFGVLIMASALQYGSAQEKTPASRTLKVKLHYTGSGTIDEKHKILVFLFDSPAFMQGEGMPFAMKSATSKDETVTFSDVVKSPVYVTAVYDPAGSYDGQSGPPPSGASLGLYSKTPGQPAPVNLDEGKTVEINLAFDDTTKMP